jgi:hypothetical protein
MNTREAEMQVRPDQGRPGVRNLSSVSREMRVLEGCHTGSVRRADWKGKDWGRIRTFLHDP